MTDPDLMWQLAVVDMAGTTIADGGLIITAITSAMAEVAPRQKIDLDEVRRLRGASKRDLFAALAPTKVDAAVNAFNLFLRELVSGGLVTAVPGASEAIRILRNSGVRVCLATGLDRSIANLILEQLDWTDLPDLLLTSGEVGRGRPHPDLVLTAAIRARVTSMNRVVVCGDTVNDLNSGANAGAGLLVGVLTGAHDREQLQSVPSATVVDSVADVPALLAL